jgi:GDP-L-fucose synthase
MKIYVAGHSGLVGSAVIRLIEKSGKHKWIGRRRSELNLLDRQSVMDFIEAEKPDAIIMAAAKVGGIKANSNQPVEFLTENLQIQSNMLDAAHASNIKRFLFLGSSCIYPKMSAQPIKEGSLLTGPLEPTNEPYAIAKIAGLKLVQAYRKEYGYSWISAMPTNVYGPFDNFDSTTSHVLPAFIRKFNDAKKLMSENVTLWGTGDPLREFIHSDDLASALMFLLENFDSDLPINIGTGQEIAIKQLAEIIKSTTGFIGQIIWDKNMPDGTPRKALNSSELTSLGWKPSIDLEVGIAQTYKWFTENYLLS